MTPQRCIPGCPGAVNATSHQEEVKRIFADSVQVPFYRCLRCIALGRLGLKNGAGPAHRTLESKVSPPPATT